VNKKKGSTHFRLIQITYYAEGITAYQTHVEGVYMEFKEALEFVMARMKQIEESLPTNTSFDGVADIEDLCKIIRFNNDAAVQSTEIGLFLAKIIGDPAYQSMSDKLTDSDVKLLNAILSKKIPELPDPTSTK